MDDTTIGIIGFGQFGQFLATHLASYAAVRAYDINGQAPDTLKDVCQSDVVVFAVPVQSLTTACEAAGEYMSERTLIADVTSVKVRPLTILQEHFPKNPILGTHPIFGPQSGKDGIANLPVVLINVSWSPEDYETVRTFCAETLKLRVIEKPADEHDHEMAHVMGLSHFIGRALKHIDIKDYDTNTFSYHQLVELRDLLKEDSWELFETIQNENPYAADVRKKFLDELHSLEARLNT